jgi:hypothetical protein
MQVPIMCMGVPTDTSQDLQATNITQHRNTLAESQLIAVISLYDLYLSMTCAHSFPWFPHRKAALLPRGMLSGAKPCARCYARVFFPRMPGCSAPERTSRVPDGRQSPRRHFYSSPIPWPNRERQRAAIQPPVIELGQEPLPALRGRGSDGSRPGCRGAARRCWPGSVMGPLCVRELARNRPGKMFNPLWSSNLQQQYFFETLGRRVRLILVHV